MTPRGLRGASHVGHSPFGCRPNAGLSLRDKKKDPHKANRKEHSRGRSLLHRHLLYFEGWGLAVGGGWQLAVGGPWGLSCRAVLHKKNSGFLGTALAQQWGLWFGERGLLVLVGFSSGLQAVGRQCLAGTIRLEGHLGRTEAVCRAGVTGMCFRRSTGRPESTVQGQGSGAVGHWGGACQGWGAVGHVSGGAGPGRQLDAVHARVHTVRALKGFLGSPAPGCTEHCSFLPTVLRQQQKIADICIYIYIYIYTHGP